MTTSEASSDNADSHDDEISYDSESAGIVAQSQGAFGASHYKTAAAGSKLLSETSSQMSHEWH